MLLHLCLMRIFRLFRDNDALDELPSAPAKAGFSSGSPRSTFDMIFFLIVTSQK